MNASPADLLVAGYHNLEPSRHLRDRVELLRPASALDNFGIRDIVRYKVVGVPHVEFSKSFYSPHEVAAMASVHPSTILNYITAGRLYAVKLSERTYRIPVRAVIGLLEPERLTRSSTTLEPDADLEHELGHEREAETIGA